MARMARVMSEGIPFHVTHRGNHKEQINVDNQSSSDWACAIDPTDATWDKGTRETLGQP